MTQRTSVDIASELAEFRAARAKLIKGEQVESVNRDGRAMRLTGPSLSEVNDAIRELEREYEMAVITERGGSRRSAIGHVF